MRCEAEKKFLASIKQEPAFIAKGFTYLKEGRLKRSRDIKEVIVTVDAVIVLPQCTKDVGELQSQEHEAEKTRNREMLLLVLQSVQFLARWE